MLVWICGNVIGLIFGILLVFVLINVCRDFCVLVICFLMVIICLLIVRICVCVLWKGICVFRLCVILFWCVFIV